jgi:hypothetical protein
MFLPSTPKKWVVPGFGRPSKWGARCLALMSFLCVMPEGTHAQKAPQKAVAPIQETFVVLRTGQNSQVVYDLADDLSAGLKDGQLCLDLEQFAEAVEFPIDVDPRSKTATGWFFDVDQKFHLDMAAHRVSYAKRSDTITPDQVIPTEDGFCVRLGVLEKWFGLKLEFDKRLSLVQLTSSTPLAFQQKLKREAGRQALSARASNLTSVDPNAKAVTLAYSWYTPPVADITIDSTVNYGPRVEGAPSTDRFKTNGSVVMVGELARFTAEALLRVSSQSDPSLRLRLYRRDPRGGVFGLKDLSEFVVGDVSGAPDSLVSLGGFGRGLAVSSFPGEQVDAFSATTLSGDRAPGWDAELYRDDTLIASQQADDTGRYVFREVQVLPGTNRFKVILYGPLGQKSVIDRTIEAARQHIPKGKVYARFSVYEDGLNLFGGLKTIGASHNPRLNAYFAGSLMTNLTYGVGYNQMELNGEQSHFLQLSGQTTFRGNAIKLTNVDSLGAGRAQELAIERAFRGSYGALSLIKVGQNFISERIDDSTHLRLSAELNTSLKFLKAFNLPLVMRLKKDWQRNGQMKWTMGIQTGLSFRQNWITNSLSLAGQSASFNEKARLNTDGSLLWSRLTPKASIRWQVDYSLGPKTGIKRVSLGYDPIGPPDTDKWRIGGSLSYAPREHYGSVSLNTQRRLKAANLSLYARFDTKKTATFGVTLSMSFGPDPLKSKWQLSSAPQANAGRAVARVFEDANRNGLFDNGEALIPHAEIMVASRLDRASTDDEGRAVFTKLESDKGVEFLVDPDSLASGQIANGTGSVMTYARAGAVTRVDIPVTLVGSVDGKIKILTKDQPVNLRQLVVRLLDKQNKEVAHTRLDREGRYYFDQVFLGDYVIAIDTEAALRQSLTVPEKVTVRLTKTAPDVTAQLIAIRHAQALTAGLIQ